jgi:hypothetical protein
MHRDWPAYAAAAWAFLFAALSLYWAAGGTAAIETVGGEVERLGRERDPEFVATLWGLTALRVVAGVAALALVRPWGRRLPQRALVLLLGVGGALVALYETAELVQHLLMAAGVIDRDGLDDTALYGHLLLWDPWWIAGGCLFALAAWRHRERIRTRSR